MSLSTWLPAARGCTYKKFQWVSSLSPEPRAASAGDGDAGLGFSFSITAEKMGTHKYHLQPSSVPEGTTGAGLLICMRTASKLAPKSGCDGKSEDQPPGGCDRLKSCHSDGRQRTCSPRSGLQPQSHTYDVEPEQDWGGHFQRRAWGIQTHLE